MPLSHRSRFGLRLAVLPALLGCLGGVASAQQRPILTQGYEKVARVGVVNEEIVRQPDLWQMECQFRSMRLVWLPKRDAVTGAETKEPILYLPFRACRRPVTARFSGDVTPINEFDKEPGPKQFIPQATLITYDDPRSEVPVQIIQDSIIPEAMPLVLKVERAAVKNVVDLVQNVPAPIPVDAENQEWQLGVFLFRGIKPDTDFFKVIVTGCSNGYEKRTLENGQTQVWRKAIVQRFQRPGDQYDQVQREFQFVGDPQWILIPDNPQGTANPGQSPGPAFVPVSVLGR